MYKDNPKPEIYEYDELDELIKSMAEYSTAEYSSTDYYSSTGDIGNPIIQDISTDDQPTFMDWNAVVKLANENNKRREEIAANLKIAEYKAANPSQADRTIRRTFRVKRGANAATRRP
jgi:hypothetical protein